MKVPKKLVWAEGVVLTQQHFQQWDSIQAATHTAWHGALCNFPWGVESVIWSTAEQINQVIELQELKAIFPNGRMVHFKQQKNEPVRLVIDEHMEDESLVFIAMADNDLVSGITGYEQPQAAFAWYAKYNEVADAYDAKRNDEVLYAQPRLTLLTESELKSGLLVLPVGLIRRQANGHYALDEAWQPNLIRLNKKARSYELLKDLQQLLLHRVSQYQEKRRYLGDLSSFSSVELAGFMLQKDLATLLNDLNGFLVQESSHPYTVFQLLNRLIAQLRLYVGSWGEHHEYQHHNQIRVLEKQTQEIEFLLSELSYEQDVQLRLISNQQGILVTDEHSIHDFNTTDFFLVIKQSGLTQAMLDRFPDFCKVAAESDINQLVETAMPGLSLRYCKRIPTKIRQKSGCEYFAIEKDDSLWQKAKQERSLAIFCTGEFTDAEIELLAVDAD